MMKARCSLLAAATLLGLVAGSEAALVIDFENPPYVAGELNGQVDFTGGGATNDRWVIASGAAQVTNSPGTGFVRSDFDAADFDAVSSLENLAADDLLVEFSFDITLPQLDSGSPILGTIELRGDSTGASFPELIVALQIRNDGRLRLNGVNFNNAVDDTDPFNVKLVLDYDDLTIDLFLDDAATPDGTVNFSDSDVVGLDHVRLTKQNGAVSASQTVRIDNINVDVIPEPASLALVGGGVLCMFPRTRWA